MKVKIAVVKNNLLFSTADKKYFSSKGETVFFDDCNELKNCNGENFECLIFCQDEFVNVSEFEQIKNFCQHFNTIPVVVFVNKIDIKSSIYFLENGVVDIVLNNPEKIANFDKLFLQVKKLILIKKAQNEIDVNRVKLKNRIIFTIPILMTILLIMLIIRFVFT